MPGLFFKRHTLPALLDAARSSCPQALRQAFDSLCSPNLPATLNGFDMDPLGQLIADGPELYEAGYRAPAGQDYHRLLVHAATCLSAMEEHPRVVIVGNGYSSATAAATLTCFHKNVRVDVFDVDWGLSSPLRTCRRDEDPKLATQGTYYWQHFRKKHAVYLHKLHELNHSYLIGHSS